jgi:hypothetical protein
VRKRPGLSHGLAEGSAPGPSMRTPGGEGPDAPDSQYEETDPGLEAARLCRVRDRLVHLVGALSHPGCEAAKKCT